MLKFTFCPVVLVAALFAGAAIAHAGAPIQVAGDEAEYGPTIVGDSVAYGIVNRDAQGIKQSIDIVRKSAGGQKTTLAQFAVGNYSYSIDLASDGDQLAAALTEVGDCSGGEGAAYQPCTRKSSIVAGTPPSGIAPACGPNPYMADHNELYFKQPLIAASGFRIAWPADDKADCGPASHLRIRNTISAQPDIVIPVSAQYLTGLAIAGDWLAWTAATGMETRTIGIYRISTRSIVKTWTFPSPRYYESGVSIQDDGKAAVNLFVYGDPVKKGKKRPPMCKTYNVVMLFMPDGGTQCLPGEPVSNQVQITGDSVYWYATGRQQSALKSKDLNTQNERILRRTTTAEREPFDVAGGRIAWRETGCAGDTLQLADLPLELQPVRTCPFMMKTRRLTLTRANSIKLAFACPNGCRGIFSITSPKRLRTEVVDGDFVNFPASALTRSKRLRVTPAVRKYLRAHRRAKIKLEWTSITASIDGHSSSRTYSFKVRRR